MGLDWTIDPREARSRIGKKVALQGNLDPAVLLTDPATIAREATKILAAAGPAPAQPRLGLSSDKVVVTAFKPSDDGKGWIVRLFGASGKPEKVKLAWASPTPKQVWLSDTSEQPRELADASVAVPGWGIVTLRAE